MIRDKISIDFKNDMSELDALRNKLEEFGKSLGFSKKSFFHILLAVEEICTNIISYGFKDTSDHWINMTAHHQNGTLELRIEDDGIPFNPIEAETPDLECLIEEREVGGLGCHLVNTLMDDVIYQRIGNKNVLILKKAIRDSCNDR